MPDTEGLSTVIQDYTQYHGRHRDRWRTVCQEVHFALEHRLSEKKIYGEVTHRVKSLESAIGSIERFSLTKPEHDIWDICGIRIVCVFSSSLDAIEEIIYDLFDVFERKDKRAALESNKMGYQSRHYHARFSRKFAGPRYDGLRADTFEVQLRTVMQHAWATASHEMVYKGVAGAPLSIVREINNISSSLEILQSHIDQTDTKIRDFVAQSSSLKTLEAILSAPISASSLMEYCNYKFGYIGLSENWTRRMVADILFLGYETIKELEPVVEAAIGSVMAYAKDHPEFFPYSTDYLSKCLSFADERYLEAHPVSELTRQKAEEFRNAFP